MGIIPAATKIFIKLDQMTAGALDLSGQNMLSEQGIVTHVGAGVDDIKPGDKIIVKVWGCDHCQVDGEDYYVVDAESKAILGILQ